ncbi:unnamed protein product [Paramecium pentaurelia]|uniref:Uncharacterized protein n=1 Tax=Paramecium pentaurelia TaxID=43138 RepID=A0A8S1VXR4_9CILI|nr:unnamed protein product [Paramecium pentaurelia]
MCQSTKEVTDEEVTQNGCQAFLKDKEKNLFVFLKQKIIFCARLLPKIRSGLGELSYQCFENCQFSPLKYQNVFWYATTSKCIDGNICVNIDQTNIVDCTNAIRNLQLILIQ